MCEIPATSPRKFFLEHFLAACLLAFSLAPALAASFDCAKAKTLFERTVCASEELSRLDDELDRAYRAALERQSQVQMVKELKGRQREWLRAHQSEKDARNLAWVYEERIGYLRNLPDFPAPDTPVEPSFPLNDISKTFDFTIRLLNSFNRQYERHAPGQVLVHKKGEGRVLQILNLDNIYVFSKNDPPNIEVDDFNFDGHDDFAIQDDGDGGTGRSYAVYLFDPKSAGFQRNDALSALAGGYGDMPFHVVPDRKRLFNTYGRCCESVTRNEWAVINNKPVLVSERTEEYVGDSRMKITEKYLVKGKWRRTIRYERLDE
jgi:uncharacterized protein